MKYQPRLTEAQVIDIRLYLEAHKWSGAQAAIANKYGISTNRVCRIAQGKLYKQFQPVKKVGQ